MVTRPFLIRRLAWALASLAAALLAIPGCQSDGTSAAGVTHPTMIEVAPVEFMGALGCSEQPGSVQRYVATLFDVTDLGAGGAASDYEPEKDEDGIPKCGGFQLPSSEPTSCLTSVGFGYVVHGRRYCAEVDAYDTAQLVPRGTGTRQMVVGAPGDGGLAQAPLAERRWHTYCEGAMSSAATIVRGRGCLPLFPQFPPEAAGGVRIDTAQLLGNLECGSEPGQIDTFNFRVRYEIDGVELGPSPQASCGDDLIFPDLPANVSVSIAVTAYQLDSETVAGATCHARTLPGTTVVADCAPLNQHGTLRVDLESALEVYGLDCDEDVTDIRVQFVDTEGQKQERHFPPPDCLEPFDVGFMASPDEATVIVTITHQNAPAAAVCHGKVEPGRVVVAECDPAEDVPDL